MKNTRKQVTLAQQNQRELAWLLYISEGFTQNLIHAMAVNAFTLGNNELNAIDGLLMDTELAIAKFRNAISTIEKE